MKTPANILIVDDDRDVLETARMFLKQEFSSVDIEEDPSKIPGYFEIKDYDVILLDMNFKKGMNDGEEGFYWLGEILKIDPQAIVILITAYGEVDVAVKAMKQGATDFVLKPWKNQKLLGTILSALQLRKSKKEVIRLKETQNTLNRDKPHNFNDFIGESPAIQRVKDLITKVAKTDADILVLGENGTGKELVARAIHNFSLRSNEIFISVDLGAVSETLFESELFGHVKGAFTDARQDKPGRFELANEGTIFLDEIGNLSMPLQAKLLTVLQSRKIRRVGATREVDVDFRLVCATNMPLSEMVYEQKFRQDLLYRINTVEIRIPSLRERIEDIPLLVDHFLSIYSRKYHKPGLSINKHTVEKLKNYHWPGNIRELQHAVERAVILSEGDTINSVESFISPTTSIHRVPSQAKTLDEMERDFILQSLEENNGNVTQTAKNLGITRTALYRRMNKHGI
ncbi:sigma-54-dependent Fis family transcriptional regulator [Fulvivirga sp. 29W222]|uniref:Sigma-54-dependent Fis family transcriptional regulator n=1 Tax=Fulvivirga marina TaxID=2494733 RepID=A0A937FZP9_9BACT|nr:sigma-54 dependent transcriptional regulator [Fulvivirga marina]MBL6447913.1 sigma-54-dependent Fis family transcriptional regulator [Fulvivirga marina]